MNDSQEQCEKEEEEEHEEVRPKRTGKHQVTERERKQGEKGIACGKKRNRTSCCLEVWRCEKNKVDRKMFRLKHEHLKDGKCRTR